MKISDKARSQFSERIAEYKKYCQRYCISDKKIRKLIADGKKVKFDRIRFKVGSIVRSRYIGDETIWLVVGHHYTGLDGTERGCNGCKIIGSRVNKRIEWLGPESGIRPFC
jgi:hypothetical protein